MIEKVIIYTYLVSVCIVCVYMCVERERKNETGKCGEIALEKLRNPSEGYTETLYTHSATSESEMI